MLNRKHYFFYYILSNFLSFISTILFLHLAIWPIISSIIRSFLSHFPPQIHTIFSMPSFCSQPSNLFWFLSLSLLHFIHSFAKAPEGKVWNLGKSTPTDTAAAKSHQPKRFKPDCCCLAIGPQRHQIVYVGQATKNKEKQTTAQTAADGLN